MRRLLLFLFSHRLLAIARWDFHLIAVRLRNAITGQGSKARRFLSTRKRPVFLNLGSGPRGVDDGHWVNVDAFRDKNVHFLLDLSRQLPFPESSFSGAFCEHVLEHFTLEDGEKVAREVRRVLEPGGRFRIVVPDAEAVVRCYLDAPKELVAWRGEADLTPMETVNSVFRQRYEHQFLHDWPTMEKVLLSAGFSKVFRSRYNENVHGVPIVLDDAKYEWGSLYVEAVK
jgi:predicted SAM-dependent methyltransferase